MFLGLTILLVLLAWTLGNTIKRSTNPSPLDAFAGRLVHSISVSRIWKLLHSSLRSSLLRAIDPLRHIELQSVLTTTLPLRNVVGQVATTSHLTDRSAWHIGRTSVGIIRQPSLTQDSFNLYCRSLLRLRGAIG